MLPFSNGETIPIHVPILFPRARDGEPCVAYEDLGRDAVRDEADGDVIDAAANEEQIVKMRALFRRFESEVSSAIADHTMDRASIGGIPILDVKWSPEVLNDDVLPQIGEAHTLKLVEAEFFQRNVIFACVGITVVDGWNVRQDFNVVAAGWCLQGIGARRGDNIMVGSSGSFLSRNTRRKCSCRLSEWKKL